MGLSDGHSRHRGHIDSQIEHELGGCAHQSPERTAGDAGASIGGGLGDVLGLADAADPVDGIWAVVRVKKHHGEELKTVRCSLRVIRAASENEAWGRLWSALLTSGSVPRIEGSSMVWTERRDEGCDLHREVRLLRPNAP